MKEHEGLLITQYLDKITEYKKARLQSLKAEGYREEYIQKSKDYKLIFRGQADYRWALTPNLFRKTYELREEQMIERFLRRFPEMQNLNELSILANMRHYGVPTRILDWTDNFLVALYFACEDLNTHTVDGAIYLHKDGSDYWEAPEFCDFWIKAAFIGANIRVFSTFCKSWLENWEKTLSYRSYRGRSNLHKRDVREGDLPYVNYREEAKLALVGLFINTEHAASNAEEILQAFDDKLENALIPKFLFNPTRLHEILYLPHVNSRITAQHGLSTLHLGKLGLFKYNPPEITENIEDLFLASKTQAVSPILKIKVLAQDKAILKKELKAFFGIHRGFIYPDDKVAIAESLYY